MSGSADQGSNLLFILSQPRSGSTMLQRVLGAHSECMATAEPWVLLPAIYSLRSHGIKAEYSETTAFRGLRGFLSVFDDGEEAYYAALRNMWITLYGKAAATEGKRVFIDKTPRYYLIAEEIRRLFPDAVMVVLIRNPMAVLVSVLDTWVKKDWGLLDRKHLLRDLMEGPGFLQRFCDQTPSVLTVKYEHFVKEPEAVVKQICDRLGLTFEPQMLRYGEHRKPAGELGDPVGVDREDTPVPHREERWKQRISSSMVVAGVARSYLQALDASLLRSWGYSPEEMLISIKAGERWWSRWLPWGLLLRKPNTWPGKGLKPLMILLARLLEGKSQ